MMLELGLWVWAGENRKYDYHCCKRSFCLRLFSFKDYVRSFVDGVNVLPLCSLCRGCSCKDWDSEPSNWSKLSSRLDWLVFCHWHFPTVNSNRNDKRHIAQQSSQKIPYHKFALIKAVLSWGEDWATVCATILGWKEMHNVCINNCIFVYDTYM